MAYIKVMETTENAITVQMSGLDTMYGASDRVCSWYLDGSYKGISTLDAKVSSGGSFTFEYLSPGKSYNIFVSITAPGWGYTVDLNTTAETESAVPPIEKWSWQSSNGNASVSQTDMAYSAVNNQGKLSDFSYLVWNDMVDKVKEILDATDDRWDSHFASYNETQMSQGDKKLTALRFNSLRYNIETHYSTGIDTVHKGDTVYGYYLTTLTDCINSWIDNLVG